MPNLLFELQSWFASLITSPLEHNGPPIPRFDSELLAEIRQKIAPSPTLTSEERIGIYKQQYWWRLIALCQEDYPSLVHLLGYETFNRIIAEPYLLEHPPKEWFLPRLGTHLPRWIKKHVERDDATLLASLAQIDFAHVQLFFTDSAPPLEMSNLETAQQKKWFLQPTVLLFSFSSDLFPFRCMLLKHSVEYWKTHDLPQLSIDKQKRYFVLYRWNESNEYKEISPSFFRVLKAFKKGACLEDIAPLLEKVPDLVESFQWIAAKGWLTSIPYVRARSTHRVKSGRGRTRKSEWRQKEN